LAAAGDHPARQRPLRPAPALHPHPVVAESPPKSASRGRTVCLFDVVHLGGELARIKEHADLGHNTDTAVRHGPAHTGRIITSAATLMVIVFGSFATGRAGSIEQLGFGLAVAVLVDATVVRYLLVPATMTLMGRWNWWAPAPLRRLHDRIGVREAMPKP
jgi:hypothetical protein